jgi:tight adherence protein C
MTSIDPYLPAGLTIEGLLAYLIGGVTFVSVIAVWRNLVEKRPKMARTRAVARSWHSQEAVGGHRRKRHLLHRRFSLSVLVIRRLRLLQTSETEKIRYKLFRAGLRSREAMGVYLIAKLVCPMAFAIVGGLLIYVLQFGHMPTTLRPVVLVAIVVFGFLAPDLYLSNVAARRQRALQRSLPDGLDLLVICAEAGLSLDAALQRVADEMAVSAPELADEFMVTTGEFNLLPERRLALLNLAKRADLPAIRAVVTTLIQTERYGTPLAHSLRVLSGEFREQRMLQAEEKAARLPATLTVPMIVFILPTLFIVLIGPAILDVYDNIISNS